MSAPVTADPYAGRDARTRLVSDHQGFERIEPTTRRALLAVGIVTLGMGLAPWLAGQTRKPPQQRAKAPAQQRAGSGP